MGRPWWTGPPPWLLSSLRFLYLRRLLLRQLLLHLFPMMEILTMLWMTGPLRRPGRTPPLPPRQPPRWGSCLFCGTFFFYLPPPSPPVVLHPISYSLLAFRSGRPLFCGLQQLIGAAFTGFLPVLSTFNSEVCTVPQPPFPKVSLRQFEGFGG
jgi:hypothetical protein